MNKSRFLYTGQVEKLAETARITLNGWINVDVHPWRSLYAWNNGKLYDTFGDQVGKLEENTVYLYRYSTNPEEDLFHELGHAIARKFDLIGHQKNGYYGSWENRQKRLIAQIQHNRHWSPLLQRIYQQNQREGNLDTPALGSELWAELFMSWHLYPERSEREYIGLEMQKLANTAELMSIRETCSALKYLN